MVTEVTLGNQLVYQCDLCGFGYEQLETAEGCEEHCTTKGFTSSGIARKAVIVPRVQVIPAQ